VNLETLAQLTVNGLINGSAYGLLGVGFALILGVTGRFHFAYALTYTGGAYGSALLASAGVPAGLAVVIGLLVAIVLGVLIETVAYRPVASRAGVNALLSVFVASLMLTIVGEAFVNLMWGLSNQNRQLTLFTVTTHAVGSTTFTNLDVVIVAVAWAVIALVVGFLRTTDAGRQIRAVRSNTMMAEAVGISARRVFLLVFAIGSLISGIAGVLYTVKYAAVPNMGERPVFYAFVVAFLAGTRRSPIVVGASGLALGLIESWSGEWLSAQWSSLVVFAVLFFYLTRKAAGLELAEWNFYRRVRRAPMLARRV
jgi:branched-chain amino acid transport system permease protein